MGWQATRIERLEGDHPGLITYVDTALDEFLTLTQIQAGLMAKFQVSLSLSTISSYKNRRWKIYHDAVEEKRRGLKAKAKLIGEDGLDAAGLVALWEIVQGMSTTQLLALRRIETGRAKLLVENKLADARLQEAGARLAQVEKQRGREQAAVKAAITGVEQGGGEHADGKAELVRRIDEIYGVHQEAPTAALPGEVGGGWREAQDRG